MAEKSIGESRVRIAFNPANDSTVDQIKQKSADLINVCEELKSDATGAIISEKIRLVSLAQTAY